MKCHAGVEFPQGTPCPRCDAKLGEVCWPGINADLLELPRRRAEVDTLRGALKNLHDWYVEYARINNLFNGDGTPATFHELLEARKLL